MTRHNTAGGTAYLAAITALIALLIGGTIAYAASGRTLEACTVLGKTIAVAEGSSTMRVTTSCGTFTVRDTLLPRLTVNAADRYGALTEGRTYALDVAGWRLPLLSTFPTILDHQEVSA